MIKEMKMTHKNSKIKGFTLVEMLVAVLIFSIVSLMIYGIFGNQFKFFLAQQDFSNTTLKMSSGLSIMTMDLSLTGADPLDKKFFYPQNPSAVNNNQALVIDELNDWNANRQIKVRADRNGDGTWLIGSNDFESIAYTWNVAGKWLTRNGLTLMDNVTSVNYRFFGEDGAEMTLAAAKANQHLVTLVKMDIGMESTVADPHTGNFPIRTLSTSVRLINR
jgi:prepilin-type N-terminal cleavage/methylation domain-containing protein